MAVVAESPPPLAPPAERGRLVVHDRVIERVARRAARDVDNVTRARPGAWRSLTGALGGPGDGTRVDVDRTDDRVALTVHLAVGWPQSIPAAATAARDAVQDAVTRYAGVAVEHTDVLVDVAPSADPRPAGTHEPSQETLGAPGARPPVLAPRAALPSALLALALVGVGVVAVRDALVWTGALGGTPWLTSTADAVSGATPSPVVLVGGVVAVLLGLWFVVAALRPRPHPFLPVTAGSDVWMRSADVARVARTAASRTGGVSQVATSTSRRSVTVAVTGRTGTSDLEGPVRTHVEAALAPLAAPPRVRVRMKAPPASTPRPATSRPATSRRATSRPTPPEPDPDAAVTPARGDRSSSTAGTVTRSDALDRTTATPATSATPATPVTPARSVPTGTPTSKDAS